MVAMRQAWRFTNNNSPGHAPSSRGWARLVRLVRPVLTHLAPGETARPKSSRPGRPLGPRVDRANRPSRLDLVRAGATRGMGASRSLTHPSAAPHSLAVLSWGWATSMDRFATPSECWEQAALCRTRTEAAADERLRAVLDFDGADVGPNSPRTA